MYGSRGHKQDACRTQDECKNNKKVQNGGKLDTLPPFRLFKAFR